jgi:hypothetical protein
MGLLTIEISIYLISNDYYVFSPLHILLLTDGNVNVMSP